MIADLKFNSQMALSEKTIKKFGVNVGDVFEIVEFDGKLVLCPVVEYPEETLERIRQIIEEHEKEPRVVYASVDEMFEAIGIPLDDDEDV